LAPSSSPSPSLAATPTANPTPVATPRSDRYKLLKACPNTPKCWIYTVRSGDNVYSIAHYFGVSQDSIYARNPWLRNTGLRAGQQLRLPPPTR
jgi:LysM repeat protein